MCIPCCFSPPKPQKGFELVPLVIAVGDYVLTPEICVERKSLSDLFQSMSSGRLYNQVDFLFFSLMVKTYIVFKKEKIGFESRKGFKSVCTFCLFFIRLPLLSRSHLFVFFGRMQY